LKAEKNGCERIEQSYLIRNDTVVRWLSLCDSIESFQDNEEILTELFNNIAKKIAVNSNNAAEEKFYYMPFKTSLRKRERLTFFNFMKYYFL
jgi:hypothetical protein